MYTALVWRVQNVLLFSRSLLFGVCSCICAIIQGREVAIIFTGYRAVVVVVVAVVVVVVVVVVIAIAAAAAAVVVLVVVF